MLLLFLGCRHNLGMGKKLYANKFQANQNCFEIFNMK
jgi:hypothetical protein